MLKIDLRKTLFSPLFYVGILILFLSLLFGCYEDFDSNKENGLLYLFEVSTTIGVAHVILPVLTSLPFALSFMEENKDGFIYYNLIRSKKWNYVISKIVTGVISALLVSFLAIVLFCITCCLMGHGSVGEGMGRVYTGTFFDQYVQSGNSWVILMAKFAAFILYGAVWPLISMAISTFSNNRYVVVAAPFLISRIFSYITELSGIHYLVPGLTLLKGKVLHLPFGGMPYAVTYHGVFIGIFSIVFILRMKRKFIYG